MNFKICVVILLLTTIISCNEAPKKRLLKNETKRSLQLFGGSSAQPTCPRGYHWEESTVVNNTGYYRRLQRFGRYYNQGRCEPNSKACKNYDVHEGNCLECEWGQNLISDLTQGHFCEATWYMTLLILACCIVGFAVIVVIFFCVIKMLRKRSGY